MKLRHIYILLLALSVSFHASAQMKVSEGLEMDKTVHNFGDIKHKSGPVSCSFTLTNTSSSPTVIYQVVSSCGCTDVEWTKEPIMPGKKGKISASYSNDEGPYPFDKTLTVYVSGVNKPVLLKIRGVSVETEKPLEESYPDKFGPFSMKTSEYNCGSVEQGQVKNELAMVANLSNQPLKITFKDVSENLDIRISPNPIPARSTAEMHYSVTADRKLWGNNEYVATPVANGKTYGDKKIHVKAFTRENFDNLTNIERSNGPRPRFDVSTIEAGMVKQGEKIHAEFTFKNEGKQPFEVYKVDVDAPDYKFSSIPSTKPGEKTTFSVDVDTSRMPKGEMLVIVTLTTNSPLRPVVNIFITGWIE